MLLSELIRYHDRYVEENGARQTPDIIPPSGYQMQPIKGIIRLDASGTFLGIDLTDGGLGNKDRGKRYPAPDIVRAAGIRAKLLVDNAEYVLGFARREGDKKVVDRHAAFIAEINKCYDETKAPVLKAVKKFLSAIDHAEVKAALWQGFTPDSTLTFNVDGKLPIDDPLVQAYWAREMIRDSQGSTEIPYEAESLISGVYGPAMTKEPVKIKGIPDGQTSGMNFISANASAFGSYGLRGIGSAPVLVEEAEKYANALNRLLSDKKTHLRLGGLAYIFWTREGDTPPISEALTDPTNQDSGGIFADPETEFSSDSAQVRSMLRGAWSGQKNLDIKATDFFAVGLSASGARVAVRSYITITIDELIERLANFYLTQKLVLRSPTEAPVLGIYALAASLYRDFRKESAVHDLAALVAFSLQGDQLPYRYLQRLTARNRAERRVTRPRAALAKMTLISRGAIPMGTMEELDTSYPNVAYQLGRLLAVLDDIQSSVMKVNSTLVDRFYGSMSTTPKSVWGRLMMGTQPHLARLRKEKPGAYYAKQRMLEEVNSRIQPEDVPGVLSLTDQALFSLGYYHQRAAISRDIQAAVKAKAELNPGAEATVSEGA